ncbi:uncharacterized protein LOC113753646 [Coffea eugenioides]|uniref:uncharacterized protein LOC113753646 n=1 Tax=Coffea eugenioides TaxID=49369 RepID=UPI000F60912C|nr:uncharacterized protein LOC113753646 [Coffea eugenioides]
MTFHRHHHYPPPPPPPNSNNNQITPPSQSQNHQPHQFIHLPMASKIVKPPPPPPLPAPVKTLDDEKEQSIQELLSYIIFLKERINRAVMEANSFKSECYSLYSLVVDILGKLPNDKLRNDASTGPGKLYERPIRRVMEEVAKQFEKTLALVRKCNRGGVFRRLVSIVSATDFKKLQSMLESSMADITWLLNIFDGGGGIILSLPPIASNDPIISWVWAAIASLYMGQINDKIEAANQLASLAKDNDRNKKYIVEEGGIAPLLKLLKENSSVEAQIAAAMALIHLANDDDRVCVIIKELGVPVIVQVLGDSPMRVQIKLANLVARMAGCSPLAQEDFARENVIKPLVTLLLMDGYMEEASLNVGKQSFHAIVEINKEREKNQLHRPALGSSLSMQSSNGSSRGGHHKKDRENETPEVKLRLKTSCVEALWMLSKGSVLNSRKITETKGLLCLAKLVEKEQGELLYNSLMTIMEITAAAESDADLRRTAFKTNSLAAKAVVDQLLRVIKECDNPTLQISALRAIGSLARTFPSRETRVIGLVVQQLGHRNLDVATEAAIALGKFTCRENFLRAEHTATILEFNGTQPLTRLVQGNERSLLHGYILLCYIGLHARNSEDLEKGNVLQTLALAERQAAVGQHPELKELIAETVTHLNLYLQCCVIQRP